MPYDPMAAPGPRTSQRPTTRLAEVSGYCPVCKRYITAERSWIRRLPQPLGMGCVYPRRQDGSIDYGDIGGRGDACLDGQHYATEGHIDRHPRAWVHERCYERGLALLKGA